MKKRQNKIVCHPYPKEPVSVEDPFLIKVKTELGRYVELVWTKNVPLSRLEENGYQVIAWAEMPELYNPKENNNESR